jgi:hypothetical protein
MSVGCGCLSRTMQLDYAGFRFIIYNLLTFVRDGFTAVVTRTLPAIEGANMCYMQSPGRMRLHGDCELQQGYWRS